jgi:SAM-dependent methyltransferase/glycosyltransferase involved in cell wall biosynthesis
MLALPPSWGMNNDRVYQVYHGEEGDQATRSLTRMRVQWIVDSVPAGRILDVGCSQGIASLLLAQRGSTVTGMDNEKAALEFAAQARSELEPEVRQRVEFVEADAQDMPFPPRSFDHVVCGELFEHVEDPARVVEEVFRVLVRGGGLTVTVPLGIMPHPDHKRVFYTESLLTMLDPMFQVSRVSELERHIGAVAERRVRARRRPAYELSPPELSFLRHERDLRAQLDRTQSHLKEANVKYRDVTKSLGREQKRLVEARDKAAAAKRELEEADRDRVKREEALLRRVSTLEGQAEATRDQLEAAVAELQATRREERQRLHEHRARRRDRRQREYGRLAEAAKAQNELLGEIESWLPEIDANLAVAASTVERADLRQAPPRSALGTSAPEADEFERWRRRAAAAPGDEVVFMYSGTIHVQEKRGNRPIRLTRVYLESERPVFFNYWRWRSEDPPPEWGHPLLLQSPVDVTPTLIDRLLEADFGGKRKLMFASFPHELMVRALSRANQNGWVTIYDARDDWEEFHKVGMAKWYDPGFERFLIRHADLVTAVSRPLARKVAWMGDRADVEVVPNGLDSKFPAPPGPRAPVDPPTVGYFGHLTPKWFDWDLVQRAAKQHPDWRFELAGHQAPEDLPLPENVELLGLLSHADLAELSCRWSFAIIPFKTSALGEAVDPIKVYEYLHLGLPVLASYMPQMRDYPATVIAESRDDFLALLPTMTGRALDPEVVRPWLAENTWEVRAARYSELARRVETANRDGNGIKGLLTHPGRDGRAGAGDRPAHRVGETL